MCVGFVYGVTLYYRWFYLGFELDVGEVCGAGEVGFDVEMLSC